MSGRTGAQAGKPGSVTKSAGCVTPVVSPHNETQRRYPAVLADGEVRESRPAIAAVNHRSSAPGYRKAPPRQRGGEFANYSAPARTHRNPVVLSWNVGRPLPRLAHRSESGNATHEPLRKTRSAGVMLLASGPWGLERELGDE